MEELKKYTRTEAIEAAKAIFSNARYEELSILLMDRSRDRDEISYIKDDLAFSLGLKSLSDDVRMITLPASDDDGMVYCIDFSGRALMAVFDGCRYEDLDLVPLLCPEDVIGLQEQPHDPADPFAVDSLERCSCEAHRG